MSRSHGVCTEIVGDARSGRLLVVMIDDRAVERSLEVGRIGTPFRVPDSPRAIIGPNEGECYVGGFDNGVLRRIDSTTGEDVWRVKGQKGLDEVACLGNQSILALRANGTLTEFDAHSGTAQSSIRGVKSIAADPFRKRLAVVRGRTPNPRVKLELYESISQEPKWSVPALLGSLMATAFTENVIVAVESGAFHLVCFDTSGKHLWRKEPRPGWYWVFVMITTGGGLLGIERSETTGHNVARLIQPESGTVESEIQLATREAPFTASMNGRKAVARSGVLDVPSMQWQERDWSF